MKATGTLTLLACLLAACGGGDEPASHSAPVGIKLKAGSSDVQGTNVTDTKNINTESGNPYGAFIAEAEEVLGRPPARIEVTGVTVELLPGATIVTALNQIITGRLDVVFSLATSTELLRVPVAHGIIDINTPVVGPAQLEVDFDSTTLSDEAFAELLGGGFDVEYTGVVASGYSTAGANAEIQITFTFEAFP